MDPDHLRFATLALSAPFVGSFLGVLASRLPAGAPVLVSRSCCDHCGHMLGPCDLVPVLSWVMLHRTCCYCGAAISAFYPFIELAALAVVLWAATVASGWVLVASAVFGWQLLTLGCADWRTGLLPDALTFALGLTGLLAAFAIDPAMLTGRLIGVAAGFASLALLGWLYRKFRGRDGLGLGDAKLLAGLGAWVSWQGLPTALLCGTALALSFVLVQSGRGRKMAGTDELPFGPFLAAGGWLVWLYGPLSAN